MEGIARHPVARLIAAITAVALSLGSGFFLVLMPALTVPAPWQYAFAAAWFGTVLLTIVAIRRSPWLALVVPVVVTALALGVLYLGDKLLGWGA